jgi:hypothetical protein
MWRPPMIAWLVLAAGLSGISGTDTARAQVWAGKGGWRVILKVESSADERAGDQRPADAELDWDALLRRAGVRQRVDLTTVQTMCFDAGSGEPRPAAKFAFGLSPFDIPSRWYDADIPYEFPEVVRAISSSNEQLVYESRTRFGYFYDCIGDGRKGHLAFAHQVETPGQPAWYTVYFDLLPDGAEAQEVPPRGFVGDGLNRCLPDGDSSTGLIHSRVEVVDWNNDGLLDLLVGCGRGGMVWYPNCGSAGAPRFPYSRLVHTADGRPLDVGWSAAPHAVDWDADGRLDLLVGAEWNRLLFYRNTGDPGQPRLELIGPVRTQDSQLLSLPHTPVPESPPDVFQRDYYPLIDTVDWDGDGDEDLLAGGYVTGRIFLYENTAPLGTTPQLRPLGPLEADGQPIDVQWCAAPVAADLDGDGDLDLISGSLAQTARGGDASSSENFLYYFRNDGTRTEPRLHRVPLPREGEFPNSGLSSPRFIDWTGDGLLDLIVSAHRQIYLFRNIGSPQDPRFAAHSEALPARWGNSPLAAVQFLDWNGDGLLDGANAARVYPNSGRGSPGIFESPISLLRPGQTIQHLSGIGDDWSFQRLFDLDRDGEIDLMDADHGGHIWWHRNQASSREPDFEPQGVRLQLGLNRTGFDALQGARATYTVGDFDGDERNDLVVADTYGIVRYSRQSPAADAGAPQFEPPQVLGELRIRAVPFAADWNNDGHLDVVAGSSSDDVVVFLNSAGRAAASFDPPRKIELPSAPYGAGAPLVVTDYNGDGDSDLLVHTAYGYTCFYERSFIEAGYARAEVIKLERRPE